MWDTVVAWSKLLGDGAPPVTKSSASGGIKTPSTFINMVTKGCVGGGESTRWKYAPGDYDIEETSGRFTANVVTGSIKTTPTTTSDSGSDSGSD